ncbi:MAG: hypothetical protein ACOCUI_02190 [bacterium]
MAYTNDALDQVVRGTVKAGGAFGGGALGAGVGTGAAYVLGGSAAAAVGWPIGVAVGLVAGYKGAKKLCD